MASEPRVEVACGPPLTPDEAIRLHRRIASGDPALLTCDGRRVRVEADILAAAALWLTGADEGGVPRDPFGRVPGAATPRARAGLLATPIVHDLMNLLWSALRRAAEAAGTPLERAPAWPDGHKFAVCLTHDIDRWRKRTARQLAKELARSLATPRRLPAATRAFTRGPDPWGDLGAIADIEERRGMHSTFFVFAGRPNLRLHGIGIVNSYDASPQEVRDALRRLAARGFEVALHGSFESFASPERLRGERADLEAIVGQSVAGCRQHFLRLERPATWQAQAEAGLRYDASLGYHDADGYRAGFAFPFHPLYPSSPPSSSSSWSPSSSSSSSWGPGHRTSQEHPLLELPLAIYDGGLHEWGGLDAEAAWERLRGYLERTEADGSMLGLLWHNTHFCDLDAPGYRGVYERALDWIRDHRGWGASARDIADWWTRRAAALRMDHPTPGA